MPGRVPRMKKSEAEKMDDLDALIRKRKASGIRDVEMEDFP